MKKETFRCEWVKCGKKSCGSCPHGPYWYAYHREGKKLHKRYVGKGDPRQPAGGADPGHVGDTKPAADKPHPWDDVFNSRKIDALLCWSILGMLPTKSFDALRLHYRKLSLELHPDRGGDVRQFQRAASAYAYLSKMLQGK